MQQFEILGRNLSYSTLDAFTPDGVRISVQDHGSPKGGRDVLFIHGYSQAALCWLNQVSGPLRERHHLVTYDLRGHGASDKPLEAADYRNPVLWADEVKAVIAAAGLHRPVIVAWSYAGRVALDFLKIHGADAISGLVMVAATPSADPALMGPAAPLLMAMANAPDAAANLAATQALLAACVNLPLPEGEAAMMLGYNLLCPPHVRSALRGREGEYGAVLEGLNVPVLAIHGEDDQINLPAMSDYTVSHVRDGRLLLYPNCGHAPFWEQAAQFDADLSAFLGQLPPL